MSSGGVKKKPTRIWKTRGEYTMIRSGPPFPCDPEECLSTLQERSLTLFKHVDPNVEFAQDPKRPLYKGVFRMSKELGYADDEFYEPTQKQLGRVYADRFKKDQPTDNLVQQRAGGEPFPYWIDDWQHVKNNDQKHKQNSKNRKMATVPVADDLAEAAAAAAEDKPAAAPSKKRGRAPAAVAQEDASGMPTVAPCDGRLIFPISGWMKTATTTKGAAQATVTHSTMLRASPAASLAKSIKAFFHQMGDGSAAVVEKDKEEEEEPEPEPVVAAPPPPPLKKTKVVAVAVVPEQHVNGNGSSLTLKLRQAKAKFIAEKANENALFKAFLSGEIEHDPDELLGDFVRYVISVNK
jgi:hypothetical protein